MESHEDDEGEGDLIQVNRLSRVCISTSTYLKWIFLFMGLGSVPEMEELQNFFFRVHHIIRFFDNKDSEMNVQFIIMIHKDYFFF